MKTSVVLLLLCAGTSAFELGVRARTDGVTKYASPRPHRPRILVASDSPGNILKAQWERYEKSLESRPMQTKMATAAFLAGVGDLIAQRIEGSGPFAIRRFLSLVAVNVLYIVPLLNLFYEANEKLVGARFEGSGVAMKTGAMLAFDQLFNAPLCILGFFYAFGISSAIFSSAKFPSLIALLASISTKLKMDYLTTLVSNWKVWVLPQLLNFWLVPPQLRLFFANCVALVWNVVLSVLANR